jgi:hypothetical protein
MIVPRRPDARRPGPSGPDGFSPTGGSRRRAALVAADIRPSCQQISSLTASGRSGAASPAALAAYAAAPRACAPIWGVLAAWPGGPGGSHRCGSAHVTSGSAADETPTDLPGDAQLATGKRACPGDGVAGAAVPRSFGLEQSEHSLRAIRRPHRDDPPVGFAQRLRRPHAQIVPRVRARGERLGGSAQGR